MLLKDLKPSLSELNEKEAMELILTTRKNRLDFSKHKKKKKKVKNPGLHLAAYAASLSAEDLEEFIKKLEEKV